jgi:hypothetical protein
VLLVKILNALNKYLDQNYKSPLHNASRQAPKAPENQMSGSSCPSVRHQSGIVARLSRQATSGSQFSSGGPPPQCGRNAETGEELILEFNLGYRAEKPLSQPSLGNVFSENRFPKTRIPGLQSRCNLLGSMALSRGSVFSPDIRYPTFRISP